jgi:hypothetical protein
MPAATPIGSCRAPAGSTVKALVSCPCSCDPSWRDRDPGSGLEALAGRGRPTPLAGQHQQSWGYSPSLTAADPFRETDPQVL